MSNFPDFESKLRDLSQRQCQILYWVCQGLTFKEVAGKIGYGEDLVTAEMSRMYRDFGLTQQRRNVKRRILEEMICPLHLRRVSDAEMDCRDRVIEVNAPPPDPVVLREVRDDATMGLIPLKGALVPVPPPRPDKPNPPRPDKPNPPRGGLAPRPQYPVVGSPLLKQGSLLRGILVGILGTLLLLTVCVLAVLFTGNGDQILALLQPTATPLVQTVVVMQPTVSQTQAAPIPIPSAVITVLVTEPVPTPAPSAVVTVLVTQPAATPTTSPSPTTEPLSSCAPDEATGEMAGKVANDIPGTKVCLDSTVTSVIDQNTRPIDVYALDLEAGHQLHLKVDVESGSGVCLRMYNPNSTSIEGNQVSIAFNAGCWHEWDTDFNPAESGIYYFAVFASGSGVRYAFRIEPTGLVVPGNEVASDIPGTVFGIGEHRTSVIDKNTKPWDVYALSLEAGQGVKINVSTKDGGMCIFLYNPDSKSIETNQLSVALKAGCWANWEHNFIPAVKGTYYLALEASGSSVTYDLSVIGLK